MASGHGFWETLDILIGKEWRKPLKEDLVQDWVEKVVAKRQMTKAISEENAAQKSLKESEKSSGYGSESKKSDEKVVLTKTKQFVEPSVECTFRHPHVRSKLEKLMGSNVVSLMDRAYMMRLNDRILEDYGAAMDKRIKVREAEEMERVKNLVLTGRIPLDQAPPEMANHPVMLIEMYCRKLIAERRAKIKVLKVKIPTYLYWDDTPDPPSGLSIEKGHVFRKPHERLCHCPDRFVSASDEEEVEAGYMFTPEEYQKLKFENADVTQLKNSETVEEMYDLADNIVGTLQLAEQIKFEDIISTTTTLSAITGKNVDTSTAPTTNTKPLDASSLQSL